MIFDLTKLYPRGLVQLSTNPISTGWFVQKIDRKPTVFQPSYRKMVGFYYILEFYKKQMGILKLLSMW